MTRLEHVSWITDAQRTELVKHHIRTLEVLSLYELVDSLADVIPLPDLRRMAKRARQELGRDDPLVEIGQAVGHGGKPVRYAGGVKFGGHDGRD